jgi:DNA mismatch repair protein MutS
MAEERPGVVNLTMSVREWQDKVVFLRKLVPGAASRSYGVQVARLAGVPAPVLTRAHEVLSQLEQAGDDQPGEPVFAAAGRRRAQAQLALGFSRPTGDAPPAPPPSPILQELSTLNVDELTPMQALQLLARWRAALG